MPLIIKCTYRLYANKMEDLINERKIDFARVSKDSTHRYWYDMYVAHHTVHLVYTCVILVHMYFPREHVHTGNM